VPGRDRIRKLSSYYRRAHHQLETNDKFIHHILIELSPLLLYILSTAMIGEDVSLFVVWALNQLACIPELNLAFPFDSAF
jgi:deoxyxylulose-5-phosphate synthase